MNPAAPSRLRHPILLAVLLAFCSTVSAQSTAIGVPTPIVFSSGSGTLSLDFTDRDYQLILYSARRDEPDTTRSYTWTVSGAFPATRPVVHLTPDVGHASGNHDALRAEEARLAARFAVTGVPATPARKAVPFQVGASRTFAFDAFGDVPSTSVNATLVATNGRADAWLDVNATGLTTAQIQAQIDRFTDHTYPIATDVFGAPSDVDGDGKVLFLYTPLVDQVGGVAGFYRSKSLFSTSQGGDGNVADMMYLGIDHDESFYESLLAHEFQHLINYNQHVVVRNGSSEISSINEAMSHVCEDLVDQHVQGGNPSNVRTYTASPHAFSLLAEQAHDSGLRGTAYTFARSMMESYGDDVPTRLTQTALSGIANVENVAGESFEAVYEDYLARMFLAGSGLNAGFDFSYSFFTDPSSGSRSIPLPDEHAVSPQAVTVTGSVKAFAASSVRLMGTGTSNVTIDTDLSGQFSGLLIPIPRSFRHTRSLKPDYFAGFTFDGSITGEFVTGQAVTFTGTVADPANTEILLRFVDLENEVDTLKYRADVVNGAFSVSVVFPHDRAGEYEMALFAGVQDESLPFIGRLVGATVSQGSGPVELPTNFFTGITLNEPLQTSISTGSAVRLSGTVVDPAITQMSFEFTHLGTGDVVETFVDVTGDAFEAVLVFAPEQTGPYILKAFAGQKGQSLPFAGEYPGFEVAEGFGEFLLPVDFFDGFTLQEGMPTDFLAGRTINLSGTVQNPEIETVLFRYTDGNGAQLRFEVNASTGSFRKGVVFLPSQAGIYTLDVFGGPAGGSLAHRGSFSPVFVSTVSTPVSLPVDFLSGVVLDEPLSAELFAGAVPFLTGQLSDTTPTQIAVRLDSPDGSLSSVEFGSVTGGRFDVPIPLSGLPTGSYTLLVFAGPAGGSLPFIDSFTPISIVASQPRASLQTTRVVFPTTVVGETATRAVRIRNVGSEELLLPDVSLSGPFGFVRLGDRIAPGDSLDIDVFYTPDVVDFVEGTLTVTTNDPTQPTLTVPVSGAGAIGTGPVDPGTPAPVLSVSSSLLSLPETLVGQPTSSRFVIRNTGDADLTVDSLVVAGGFSAILTPGTVIGTSDSLKVDVTATPDAVGDLTGSVTVYSDGGDPFTVNLSVSATAPPVVDPNAIANDTWQSIELTTPLSRHITTDTEVAIAGNVLETRIGLILFQFRPVDDQGEADTSRPDRLIFAFVSGGLFSQTVTFTEDQAGAYELSVSGGSPNDITLPSLGPTIDITVSLPGAIPVTLLGDIDGDGTVGFPDFLSFAGAFGKSTGDPGYLATADLDASGTVDFTDFLTFAAQFGKSL